MIKEYINDLTAGGVHLGDTLESSLELGEKHEAFVTKCKNVSSFEEYLLAQPLTLPSDQGDNVFPVRSFAHLQQSSTRGGTTCRHEMLTQCAPFSIGTMAKKGTLCQHFVTHVVSPLVLHTTPSFPFLSLLHISPFSMSTGHGSPDGKDERGRGGPHQPSLLDLLGCGEQGDAGDHEEGSGERQRDHGSA